MKRIAIIEPGDVNHYVAVNSIYKIFKEGNDITIFTNQYVKKNLEEVLDSDTKYVIKKDNEGFYSFLKNIEKYAFDIIFITSLHDPHLLFFCLFNPKTRVYLTIHNANLWFGGFRFGIPESIFYFLRKSWLKKVSGINVDSDDMRGHILKKWGYPKKINVIPFNVYEGMVDNSKKDKKLHMCIPGNLSTVRRDYLSVFKVIQQLPGDYKNKLTLELLGRPCEEGSAEIIEKGKELKSGGWDIIFHEEYIPPNEFDYALSKTDIILGPVKIEYRLYENIHEVYGISKATGVNFAMIRAAKPGIIPQQLKNIQELESSTLYYSSSDDLKDKIIRLIEDPSTLNILKENAKNNSIYFTPESIRTRLDINL